MRRRADHLTTEAQRRLLEQLARTVPDSDEARAVYPAGEYPQRQPKLRTSQQVTRTTSPTRYSVKVRYTAPQANFTELGTSPHKIRAKNGPTLRFYWPRVGRVVWPVEVNHPGSHKHDGWFARVCRRWPDFLRQAQTS